MMACVSIFHKKLLLAAPLLTWWAAVANLQAAESGASVVVVYNSKVAESKQIADYYAQRRQVPANQVFGLELPVTEAMTRIEFLEKLQNPLLKHLEANKLFTFAPGSKPGDKSRSLTDAAIRYAVLCYGVPTKISKDATFVEPEAEKMPPEFRRNEAAVDSQLACLPIPEQKRIWVGPLNNPGYLATNPAQMHPMNGVLMVARLDGPSASIAKGLVDKAIDAETNGLWGRAYFDARGLTNNEYRLGDEWIRNCANATRRAGFETELDENPNTFGVGYPMSQIAFYAGWYDWNVSGPFTRPKVEFMPGAFAYHLHSFSAENLRSTSQNWVGPLLAKGATITMGCVAEPYLIGTPNVAAFMERFLYGFSFGEAACAAQNWLSWQTTVIGDPLYRPFSRTPEAMHLALENRQSKLVEWPCLRAINLRQVGGMSSDGLIDLLYKIPYTKRSALLQEKVADLYWAKRQFSDSFTTFDEVLKLDMSPQQKMRVLLKLGERRSVFGPDRAACEIYEKLIQEFPDYPDLLSIYQKLLPLAQKLGKKEEAE